MDGDSLDGYWMARNELIVRHELKALSLDLLSAVTHNGTWFTDRVSNCVGVPKNKKRDWA